MPLNQQPNTSRVLQATVSQVSRYISRTTPDNLFQVSAGPPPHMQEDAWHWLTALCGRVYKGFTTFRIMPWPFGTQEEAQAPIAHHYMFPEAISNPSEPGPSTNTLASSSERRAVHEPLQGFCASTGAAPMCEELVSPGFDVEAQRYGTIQVASGFPRQLCYEVFMSVVAFVTLVVTWFYGSRSARCA